MDFAHPDFQSLFDALLGTTRKMLEVQGAFLPHGAIVSLEGKLGLVGGYTGQEQPGAQAILQLLEGGLRGMAAKGMCRAAGMAMDVRLKAAPRKEDIGKEAVLVILEHIDHVCESVYTPYMKNEERCFSFGESFVGPKVSRIFTGK